MTQTPAIGATIWRFDENHRFYAPKSWAPIYREHWREVEITGENRRSWITNYGKCPKSGPHPGWALSLAEVDDDCWVRDHRHRVAWLLERCQDAAIIRRVAELLGHVAEA